MAKIIEPIHRALDEKSFAENDLMAINLYSQIKLDSNYLDDCWDNDEKVLKKSSRKGFN